MSVEPPEPGKIHVSGNGEYTVKTNGVVQGGIGLETGSAGPLEPQDEIDGNTVTGEVIGGTDTDTIEFYGTPEDIEYEGHVQVDAEPINNGEPVTVGEALYLFYTHGKDWSIVPGFSSWQDVAEYPENDIIVAMQNIDAATGQDTAWVSERPWFDRNNVSPENIPDIPGLDWGESESTMPQEDNSNDSGNDSESDPPETGPDSDNEPVDTPTDWMGDDNEVDLGEFAPPGEDYGSGSGGLFDQLMSIVPEDPVGDLQTYLSNQNWVAVFAIALGVIFGFWIGANLLGNLIGLQLEAVLRNA